MAGTISPRSIISGTTARRRRSHQGLPALTLVDADERLQVDGVQPPQQATGLPRDLQQTLVRQETALVFDSGASMR